MNAIRVRDVFVPGRLPDHTYNPRKSVALEARLEKLIDDGGSIICVSGLTKMGKTVLVERLLPRALNIRIDGSEFADLEHFWIAIGDQLGIYPNVTVTTSEGTTGTLGTGGTISLPTLGSISGNGSIASNAVRTDSFGTARPISAVAKQALLASSRALIIDDFHFIKRDLQREIVRTLKDPVLQGLTVLVVSTSHRTLDVILAEPNMDGRAAPLPVTHWSHEELAVIAEKGFRTLGLIDEGEKITVKLAENAFGSPHLMQKFCKEICAYNEISERVDPPRHLAPPADWGEFFRAQVEGASERWFDRLMRGPQERSRARRKWRRAAGGTVDTYALLMEALSRADSGFEVTKDQIKQQVDAITPDDGPQMDKITRALVQISKIARRKLEEEQPTEDELDEKSADEPYYVLEFVDEGPNSKVHITDPFFAYFLRWGAAARISRIASADEEDGPTQLTLV